MWWSNASVATSDSGFTTNQVDGKTIQINIGDGIVATTASIALNSPEANAAVTRYQTGGVNRWYCGKFAGNVYIMRALDASGTTIDDPLSIDNAAGSPIVLGGLGATKRPLRLTNLIGTGTRPLQVASDGTIQVAPTITREAIIQSLPITNAAPGVVNVVDANMKSFGFDGGTQVEELFYHVDLQHDYVDGSDFIFHAHWMPATATGGNVRFKCHYQWVENGGVFPAATLVEPTAVAAGTTAWADKRTDFTFSGAGKTYSSRIMIRLFRDPGDAADTYAGDAVLSAVGGHYTANPIQP
jgi:hypothetical protein